MQYVKLKELLNNKSEIHDNKITLGEEVPNVKLSDVQKKYKLLMNNPPDFKNDDPLDVYNWAKELADLYLGNHR